jgi:hypothetical protein
LGFDVGDLVIQMSSMVRRRIELRPRLTTFLELDAAERTGA